MLTTICSWLYVKITRQFNDEKPLYPRTYSVKLRSNDLIQPHKHISPDLRFKHKIDDAIRVGILLKNYKLILNTRVTSSVLCFLDIFEYFITYDNLKDILNPVKATVLCIGREEQKDIFSKKGETI